MNAASRIGGLKQSITTFWNERNRREQNMLAAAIVVVVLGLIYVLLIDPAISGRSVLEKQLPGLRQQAAEVQALAKTASTEAPAAEAPAPPPLTREGLETSLARKGLKAQNLSVTGEQAIVQFNGVSYSSMVDWLDDMQRNARLAVADAKIEAQAQVDTVNASLTLRQQRAAQ